VVTYADGAYARIHEMKYCPHFACIATPYLRSAPDATTENNLDNLPRC
jgi:hypothetical protein